MAFSEKLSPGIYSPERTSSGRGHGRGCGGGHGAGRGRGGSVRAAALRTPPKMGAACRSLEIFGSFWTFQPFRTFQVFSGKVFEHCRTFPGAFGVLNLYIRESSECHYFAGAT